jgi:TPR repeat protein
LVAGLAAGAPLRAANFDLDTDYNKAVDAYLTGDHASAWFWFLGLARTGNAESQFNLAQMYRRGQGVPIDTMEALRWYQAAASQDFMEAQFQLGVMWEMGSGVPPNLPEARRWYTAAARADHPRAREALMRVDNAIAAGRTRTVIATPAETPPGETLRPNPPARPRRLPPAAN